MLFLISLAAAFVIAVGLSGAIRRHPGAFYALFVLISAALSLFDFPNAPHFISAYVFDLFRRGALGTALFVVVMFIGALPNGSAAMKKMMPIRGYLSIMASILIICHSVFYGKTYFVKMFAPAAAGPLTPLQTLAMVLSILMLVIMLPLFVTSFQKIRRSMGAKKWKKLQRWAYLFYGLIYVHIVLLLLPHALAGVPGYAFSIGVYGLVFAVYLFLRLRKSKKTGSAVKLAVPVAGAVLALAVFLVAALGGQEQQSPAADSGEAGVLHDGTFSGSGTGYAGPVEVSIVVEGGVITEIILGDNNEDAPYLNDAVKLFDDVLEQQTYAVDSVTGATSSSVGLKSAIKKAMAQSMEAAE